MFHRCVFLDIGRGRLIISSYASLFSLQLFLHHFKHQSVGRQAILLILLQLINTLRDGALYCILYILYLYSRVEKEDITVKKHNDRGCTINKNMI